MGTSLFKKVLAGLLVVAVLAPGLSCSTSPTATTPPRPAMLPWTPGPLPDRPFSGDYRLDETNAAFFTDSGSLAMALSGSPFYGDDQALPSQNNTAYEKARSRKVEEIKLEAAALVKTALKLKAGLDGVRGAQLAYLQSVRDADPTLKPFTDAILVQIESLATQEALREATYNGLTTDDVNNAFAGSFLDYFKVVESVKLGEAYLQDIGNLAQYAALSLSMFGSSESAAIKKANEQLDKYMQAIDGLRDDARVMATSIQKIGYGMKQLDTGSYYYTLAATDYMGSTLQDLESQADRLKPRSGLTREDIAAIQGYLALFEKYYYLLKQKAGQVDAGQLVKLTVWHEGKSGIARAETPRNYANAVGSLLGQLQADPAKTADYLKLDWVTARKAIDVVSGANLARTMRNNIGVVVDVTKLVEDAAISYTFGKYLNIPTKELNDGLAKDWEMVKDNFRNNISGASVLKDAGANMEAIEQGAARLGAAGARGIGVEDKWMVTATSEAARLTVGLYTGIVRDMYTLANPASTDMEMAEAGLGMALTVTGGSKSLMMSPMTRTAEEKLLLGRATAYANSVLASEAKAVAGKGFGRAIALDAQEKAKSMAREYAGQEAIAKALRKSALKIDAELARLSEIVLPNSLKRVKSAAGESVGDLLEKNYKLSLKGVREALVGVMGKNDFEYAINLLGGLGDETIKGILKGILGAAAVRNLETMAKAAATPGASQLAAKPSTGTTAKPEQSSPASPVLGKPDLTVSTPPGVSFTPYQGSAGQTVSVTFTVKNQGTVASGNFTNRVSLGTTQYGTNYSMGNFVMDSIPPGQSKPATVKATVPPAAPGGSYWVTVFADGLQKVAESNEDNNIGGSGSTIKFTRVTSETWVGKLTGTGSYQSNQWSSTTWSLVEFSFDMNVNLSYTTPTPSAVGQGKAAITGSATITRKTLTDYARKSTAQITAGPIKNGESISFTVMDGSNTIGLLKSDRDPYLSFGTHSGDVYTSGGASYPIQTQGVILTIQSKTATTMSGTWRFSSRGGDTYVPQESPNYKFTLTKQP